MGLFLAEPEFPADYRGPLALPGTGRVVWWTGRVAIGLRHPITPRTGTPSRSALWLQSLFTTPTNGNTP